MKMLIPISSCGSVIGRGGSIIRNIGETAGCKVQLIESKAEAITSERIVQVMGPNIRNVVQVIFKINVENVYLLIVMKY